MVKDNNQAEEYRFPKRTLVSGGQKSGTKQAIRQLYEDHQVNVVVWLAKPGGTRPYQHDKDDYFVDEKWAGHFEGYRGVDPQIYDQVFEKCFPYYLPTSTRRFPYGLTRSPQDMRDCYNISYNYIWNLIHEAKIEQVLFFGVPGQGMDLQIYYIAKALGIPTLCTQGSPVALGRNYVIWDMEDMGVFDTVEEYSEVEHQTIEKVHFADHFYMKYRQYPDFSITDMVRELIGHFLVKAASVLNIRHKWLGNLIAGFSAAPLRRKVTALESMLEKKKSGDLKSKKQEFKNLKKKLQHVEEQRGSILMASRNLSNYLLDRIWKTGIANRLEFRAGNLIRIWQILQHYYNESTFKRNVKIHCTEPDLTRRFVYFPMSLQPENTTLTIAQRYDDQLLSIERLRDLLPDDCAIYIKENPKQDSKYRGPAFFERLALIPNAYMMPRDYDTFRLMEHCQFLAIITGTAGFEAVKGGTNTLVFGIPWYRSLPGVYSYRPGMDVNMLMNEPIDHKALESAFTGILRKTVKGAWDHQFEERVLEEDRKRNIQILVESIKTILSHAK